MIRLAIRAPAEHAEPVLAELLELAPAGFEQVDGADWVEFAVYGAPGELPDLAPGRATVGGVTVEVSGAPVDADWADRWREFHQPAQIRHIRVRAPWHEPASEGLDIVIDPGQAFGTGAHPTTRLCLELLADLAGGSPRAGRVADLGCGSGVLAIAAAKLGFGPVRAFDNEEAAVEATLENAGVNGVTLEAVERYDLRARPAPFEPLTVANLVRPLLLEVAALTDERPDVLIASGLLEGEEDEVAAAFAPMREDRRLRLQGWSALLLVGRG